jgi:hypothetical protein
MIRSLPFTLLLASASHAQFPTINWQHSPQTQGDDIRSYVPTATGLDPGLDQRHTVASANGAYLIVPTNTASGSDYLRLLYTPYLFATRGYQVAKLDAQGNLQWKRFVALPDASARARAHQQNLFNDGLFWTRNTLQDARETASGGLAFLANGRYVVFDAQGQQLANSAGHCDELTDFADVDTALNSDGLLYAWTPANSAGANRACAIDTSGVELDRMTFPAAMRLDVIDYQRYVGFLTTSGNVNMGVWSNTTVSLHTSTSTRWSKTGAAADNFASLTARDVPHIHPNGEVWTRYDGQFVKFANTGDIIWQSADPSLDGFQVKYWLSDGALLENPNSESWRALNTTGTTRWQALLPPALFNTSQLLPERVRVLQLSAQAPDTVHHSINLSTGAPTSSQFPNQYAPTLGFGLVGLNRLVEVGYLASTLSRSYNGACGIPGFVGPCIRQMEFARPTAQVRDVSNGATLGALNDWAFPLPSFPLDNKSWLDLVVNSTTNGEVIERRYAKHLVHDGIATKLQIQRLAANGQAQWSRTLSMPNYDAAAASFRNFGELLIASATEYAPEASVATSKLWALNESDGTVFWERTLSNPWQSIERLNFSNGTNNINACGLGSAAPYRVECMTLGGQPSLSVALQNVATQTKRASYQAITVRIAIVSISSQLN